MKESKFYQERLNEGRLEAHRKDVRGVIEVRFGVEAASSIAAAVEAINDASRLPEFNRLAARCRRLSQFQSALQ